MKYVELEQHINDVLSGRERFAPAYVVCGDDDYLRSRAISALRSVVDEDFADLNISRFSADDGIAATVDALYTYPVFGEYRAVTLSLSQKLAEADKDALKAYIASPSETSVFVLDCDPEVAATLKGKGYERVDCAKLPEPELREVINKLFAPTHTIDKEAADELIRRTQGYMSRIAGEIVKLKDFCDGRVRREDVSATVAEDMDFQIYALADAVSKKDADTALAVLDVFYKNGIRSMRIVNQLYDKYRKMLHAELNKGLGNDELGALLGMKGGAVYHLRQVSGGYSQMRLKKCVDYLHGLQYDVLSGRRTENSALGEAVLELLTF